MVREYCCYELKGYIIFKYAQKLPFLFDKVTCIHKANYEFNVEQSRPIWKSVRVLLNDWASFHKLSHLHVKVQCFFTVSYCCMHNGLGVSSYGYCPFKWQGHLLHNCRCWGEGRASVSWMISTGWYNYSHQLCLLIHGFGT